MLRLFRNWPLMAVLIGAVMLAAPPPAKADFVNGFQIRISDGTTTKYFYDDGVNESGFTGGGSAIAGDGHISVLTNIGAFNVVMTFGTSKPAIGNPSSAQMDLTSMEVHNMSSSMATLSIDVTDVNFNIVPTGNNIAVFTSSQGGNLFGSGSVAFQSFVDRNNNPFGGTSLNPSAGATASTILSFDDVGFGDSVSTVLTNFNGVNFSMTSETVVTLAGAMSWASTDGATTVMTPAPSSLMTALLALPILGVYGWRRRRKEVEQSI